MTENEELVIISDSLLKFLIHKIIYHRKTLLKFTTVGQLPLRLK